MKGDTVDIFPGYADIAYRVIFWDDEIDEIESIDPINGRRMESLSTVTLFPANIFVTSKDKIKTAVNEIQLDMFKQTEYYREIGKIEEAKRWKTE